MASTYTTNHNIELIGTGEQAGNWGDITNSNFETIDAALGGKLNLTGGALSSDLTIAGELGIGVTNPNRLLHVVSSGSSAETIASFGNASNNESLQLITDSNLEWGFNAKNNRDLIFETNQTRRMTISGQTSTLGNVGIGTTTPELPLHVDGSLLVNAYDTSNSGIFFRPQYSSTSDNYHSDNPYNLSIMTYDHSGGNNTRDGLSINAYDGVSFCTGSNTRQQRMIITDSGNVNIGSASSTVNPTATLEVVAPSSQANPLRVAGEYTGNSPLSLLLYNFSTTQNLSETPRIQAGNIGYTTSNNYSRRHHSEIYFEPNGTSGGEMSFRTGGKSGTDNTAEALRLKSNQDAEFSGSITAADGILFGSDTAAANTLSDYEEGYFTPLFEAQTQNFIFQDYTDETGVYRTIGSWSTSSRARYHHSVRGFYTKIGDTVTFSLYIYIQYIGLSGVSGNLYVKGLPYTSANNSTYQLVRKGMTAVSIGYMYGWNNYPTQAYIPSNSSHIILARLNGSTWSYITAADMGGSTDNNRLVLSGSYKV